MPLALLGGRWAVVGGMDELEGIKWVSILGRAPIAVVAGEADDEEQSHHQITGQAQL